MQTGQERRYVEQERWASGKEHLFQRSERRRVETQRRSSMHAAAMQHTQRAGERRGSTRRAREQPRRLLLQSWRCTASSGGRRRARTREPNLPCSGSRGRVLQQAQARKSETVIRCTSLCCTRPLLSDLAPPNPVRPCCSSFLELATSKRDTTRPFLCLVVICAHIIPGGRRLLWAMNISRPGMQLAEALRRRCRRQRPVLLQTMSGRNRRRLHRADQQWPSAPADHSRVMTYMHAGTSVVEKHAEVL